MFFPLRACLNFAQFYFEDSFRGYFSVKNSIFAGTIK